MESHHRLTQLKEVVDRDALKLAARPSVVSVDVKHHVYLLTLLRIYCRRKKKKKGGGGGGDESRLNNFDGSE